MNVAETRQAGDDCQAGGAADPSILMGRCTGCSQAFRAEIPSGRPVFAGYATDAARAAGYPCRHGCRTGIRCPEDQAGLPACSDWDCDGHEHTEIKYRALKITYKPGATCGPGNCWDAKGSACTCSCRGANHGRMYEVTRTVK